MQQEGLSIIFISWIPWSSISKLGDLSHTDLTTNTLIVRTILNSLCCYFPAQHLISKTQSSPQSGALFFQLGWFSIALLFWKVWFLSWFSIAFVLKVWLWCSFLFFFFLLGCRTYCEGLSSQKQCKDWFQVELRRGDMMPTLRSMIAADAQPPSVQKLASVVFGDVMEIAKLMVLLIMLTLTACGLYKNRRRPQAAQPQASSSPNSSRTPTEAMG